MGSSSDWETMQGAADMLDSLGIAHEVRVVSAHRTPDLLFEYAATARERGLKVIIAGAGGAAHLPGMTAAKTSVPVLGVPDPIQSLERHRFIAVDRPDAERHSRSPPLPSAPPARRTPRCLPPRFSPTSMRTSARRWTPSAQAQTAAVLAKPDPRGILSYPASASSVRVNWGACWRWPDIRSGYAACSSTAAPTAPGAQVAPILTGELEDAAQLAALAARSDVLTFDWENISGKALAPLEKLTQDAPAPRGARGFAGSPGGKGPVYSSCGSLLPRMPRSTARRNWSAAAREVGFPGVLKTRRLGYDGKGQFVLQPADVRRCGLGRRSARPVLIYEKFQDFSREVSIVGARSAAGRIVFYPLSANTHGGGILRYSVAPYANPRLERTARTLLEAGHERPRLCRGADHRVFRGRRAAWWPMKWRPECTTPATGPSKAASPASSKTICARSATCRSAARAPWGTRP